MHAAYRDAFLRQRPAAPEPGSLPPAGRVAAADASAFSRRPFRDEYSSAPVCRDVIGVTLARCDEAGLALVGAPLEQHQSVAIQSREEVVGVLPHVLIVAG